MLTQAELQLAHDIESMIWVVSVTSVLAGMSLMWLIALAYDFITSRHAVREQKKARIAPGSILS